MRRKFRYSADLNCCTQSTNYNFLEDIKTGVDPVGFVSRVNLSLLTTHTVNILPLCTPLEHKKRNLF